MINIRQSPSSKTNKYNPIKSFTIYTKYLIPITTDVSNIQKMTINDNKFFYNVHKMWIFTYM